MTGDIGFFQPDFASGQIGPCDIAVDGTSLVRDDGLHTAVLISLLTDRRANPGDVLPFDDGRRGGHFSDTLTGVPVGSRLWLLGRSRLDNQTLRLAEQYAQEALQEQIVDVGAAKSAEVTASAVKGRLVLSVVITKPDGTTGKYTVNWQSMRP